MALALNAKVDSREGIIYLIEWARSGGWVLNESHKAIAEKYGVKVDGVRFTRRIAIALDRDAV